MADTGAPWNIPYVEPTDLVREYPAADEAQANAIAAGLNAAGNAGIGSNVVQTVKTDTFTMTSSTFTAVAGFTATITPSSASSKILVIASINVSGNESAHVRLTGGNTSGYIGNAAGSRVQSAYSLFPGSTELNVGRGLFLGSIVFLDSPGVDTAVAYGLEMRGAATNIARINFAVADDDDAIRGRTASSITLIEVAA